MNADAGGMFGWWNRAPASARRALVAAFLGWMLDAFDVMLYALVLSALIADLNLDKSTAGLLGSLTLLAAAAGGIAFGFIADRFGRTRALMASILVYSVFTAACGFARTVPQLAIFRICLGLGMGGEWASGAALVSETWPAEDRGKALGFVQSAWAVGYGAAAAVVAIVMPIWGWRGAFFVGVLPAFLTLWVRRHVEEPAIWLESRKSPATHSAFTEMFKGSMIRITAALTFMNGATLFAWWGFNLWIPAYLSLPVSDGGIGLSQLATSTLIITMQIGMWFGYVTFGYISDWFGRKPTYVGYLIVAAVLMFAYTATRNPITLLLLGPFVAFFGTGYLAGFGTVSAELYPTAVRATAQGFTYNFGRIVSAAAPFVVGSVAETKGFPAALSLTAVAFVVAALAWVGIPETRGRALA